MHTGNVNPAPTSRAVGSRKLIQLTDCSSGLYGLAEEPRKGEGNKSTGPAKSGQVLR